jgi:hypothetical protein
MFQFIRLSLVALWIAGLATTLTLRFPAENTIFAGGKYYVNYRGAKYEISRQQYEENERLQWRNRTSEIASFVGTLSLFAFIGIESARFRPRRHNDRQSVRRRGSGWGA